ncbi:MAG: hypothetical protein ACXWQO_03575 [Bdellovibrionota bacterium]
MRKIILLSLIFGLPCHLALTDQSCSLTSEQDKEQKHEMKGNEIITHTYLVTNYWVTVAGDESMGYLRGPFRTLEEGNAALIACRKADDLTYHDRTDEDSN